jgi:hypothetical protein
VEVPVPSAKKNEVLLKLQAATINPVDWKIQKGELRPLLPRKFPFIPGNYLRFFDRGNYLRNSVTAWMLDIFCFLVPI